MKSTIVQKLRIGVDDAEKLAFKYYSVLSILNNLGLTKREIELLSFLAVTDSDSPKKDFCEKYDTSLQTVSNIVSKLSRRGIIVKDGATWGVNSKIFLDFSKNVALAISMYHEEA